MSWEMPVAPTVCGSKPAVWATVESHQLTGRQAAILCLLLLSLVYLTHWEAK